MQNINYEVGCIYDTLAFLSLFIDEHLNGADAAGSDIVNQYYVQIKKEIAEENIDIPDYICPFVYKGKKSASFLQSLVISDTPYSKCTYSKFMRILKANFKSEYIRFYYPIISASEEELLFSGDNPEIITAIMKNRLETIPDTYFLNSIVFYERITGSLIEIINILYKHISQIHQLFFQHSDIQKVLRNNSVLEKLQAITRTRNGTISAYTFALSLLNADIITFKEAEPEFMLLGYDFTNRLDNEHKYCHVTPLLFAQAIGNSVKYDIINALAKMQPMSTADMYKMLGYGKNELDYNLNEMRKSGLVIIDHIKGRKNFYRLDSELIKIVAEQLLLYT